MFPCPPLNIPLPPKSSIAPPVFWPLPPLIVRVPIPTYSELPTTWMLFTLWSPVGKFCTMATRVSFDSPHEPLWLSSVSR